MDYNDFPNLNDEDFYILSTMYQQSSLDTTEISCQILNSLKRIKNKIDGSINSFNAQIVSNLIELNQIISTQISNLNDTKMIRQESVVIKTSIFSILKDLNELSLLYLDWTQNEKKDYYKTLSFSHLKSILTLQTKIYNNLCNSYIKTFKFM